MNLQCLRSQQECKKREIYILVFLKQCEILQNVKQIQQEIKKVKGWKQFETIFSL